jgi:hypothetical protein
MINVNLLIIEIDSHSFFAWRIQGRLSSQAMLHLKFRLFQKRFNNLFINIVV